MKIKHTKMYKTSIIADKGMIFDKGLILTSNIIDDIEKRTLRIIFNGYAIEWMSTFDISDISDSDLCTMFKDTMLHKL